MAQNNINMSKRENWFFLEIHIVKVIGKREMFWIVVWQTQNATLLRHWLIISHNVVNVQLQNTDCWLQQWAVLFVFWISACPDVSKIQSNLHLALPPSIYSTSEVVSKSLSQSLALAISQSLATDLLAIWRPSGYTVVNGVVVVIVVVVGVCNRSQMRTSKCTFNIWCEYRSWLWLEMHKRNFW